MMKNVLLLLFSFLILVPHLHSQAFLNKGKTKMERMKNKSAINDFHQENIGKIIFTKERVPFKATEAVPITDFEYGSQLFAREYWDKTMSEAYSESFGKNTESDAALLYKITVNGSHEYEEIFYYHSAKPAFSTWFTNWFVAINDGSNNDQFIYNDVITNALSKYKSQISSKVNLIITSYIYDLTNSQKGNKLAEGKINISIPNSSIIPALTPQKYPPCMTPPKMSNTSLEHDFLKEINNQGWSETFKNVVINTEDYSIQRNRLTSVIETRTLGADIAAKRENKCFYQRFTFIQNHDGNNFSGTWKLHGVGEQVAIPCQCIQ